jgi:osmotically-inducible protein OsmY
MARMHDNYRRSRHRDDDDDDRARRRGIGGGYDPYDAREAWPPGYGGSATASGRHAYGYGGETSGAGRRSRNDDDADYDRYDYGRYGGGRDLDDEEHSRRSSRRGAAWYGTKDYDRYAAGGRYGAQYGASRRSGLYGDDYAASGGSIPRGRQYSGYGSESMGMSAGLQRGMGSMAGKGPKGYVRSDERIREDVCECLTDDPHLDASSIEVKVKNGEVTLSGTVESRDAKRHAEELTDRVSGVKDVQNSLRVQNASRTTEAGGKGKRGGTANPRVGPTS